MGLVGAQKETAAWAARRSGLDGCRFALQTCGHARRSFLPESLSRFSRTAAERLVGSPATFLPVPFSSPGNSRSAPCCEIIDKTHTWMLKRGLAMVRHALCYDENTGLRPELFGASGHRRVVRGDFRCAPWSTWQGSAPEKEGNDGRACHPLPPRLRPLGIVLRRLAAQLSKVAPASGHRPASVAAAPRHARVAQTTAVRLPRVTASLRNQ
jgi:hypothetical protein